MNLVISHKGLAQNWVTQGLKTPQMLAKVPFGKTLCVSIHIPAWPQTPANSHTIAVRSVPRSKGTSRNTQSCCVALNPTGARWCHHHRHNVRAHCTKLEHQNIGRLGGWEMADDFLKFKRLVWEEWQVLEHWCSRELDWSSVGDSDAWSGTGQSMITVNTWKQFTHCKRKQILNHCAQGIAHWLLKQIAHVTFCAHKNKHDSICGVASMSKISFLSLVTLKPKKMGRWYHFPTSESLLFQSSKDKNETASSSCCSKIPDPFRKHLDTAPALALIIVDCMWCAMVMHGMHKVAQQWHQWHHLLLLVFFVAQKGAWGIGKIITIHWHFDAAGDTFPGQIFTGFDTNAPCFTTPLVHKKEAKPIQNPLVMEALQLMFGPIMPLHNGSDIDPGSILVQCLAAAMVHNAKFLQEIAASDLNHPFNNISLLHKYNPLQKLKELLTVHMEGDVTFVTGIPAHVKVATMMEDCVELCKQTLEEMKEKANTVWKLQSTLQRRKHNCKWLSQ